MPQERADENIVDDREMPVGLRNLERARDTGASNLIWLLPCNMLTVEHDLARRRLERAGDEIVECALSRAIRSDEADELSGLYGEAHVADGLECAEAAPEIADLEQGGHRAFALPRTRRSSAPAMPPGK